ncbi:hypothetical protein B0H15DRAFT_383536 [Mycena belliarum]|uniref:Uncharacterized protein n=1 Tax=Mycena belliarum TaxID=1033014 RepID=A0AAD6U1A2_9AGAR|nr:hypothetical protein B0H15DRAFT_383536 [Mycena belliae]
MIYFLRSPNATMLRTSRPATFAHLQASTKEEIYHVFIGLMRIFRAEYIVVVRLLSIVQGTASFTSPVAINRLLKYASSRYYLETRGNGAIMRPWFWIIFLFVGPTIGSLATHWHNFVYNRVALQAEAILTELISEYSLLVRVKAETSELEPMKGGQPAATKGRNLIGKINNLATTDL